MPRGGARERAGRKPGPARKQRSVELPLTMWVEVEEAAEDLSESVNSIVRHAVQLWLTLERQDRALGENRVGTGKKRSGS